MTNPSSESQSSSRRKSLFLLVLKRGSIAIGGFIVVGLVYGTWRLQNFIQKELAPLAQQNLTTTLNRPVELGRVTGFSLTGVRFGASAIPATPTDPDRATIAAVEVGFDPLKLLFNRNLKLDVTLINPDIFVDQDTQGRWLITSIKQGKPGAIKTELEKIRFRNGNLVLLRDYQASSDKASVKPLPVPSPPEVTISQVNGVAQLLDKNRLIRFELQARPKNGGTAWVGGDLRLSKTSIDEAKLKVQGEGVLAADITRIVKLPLTLQAGRVNGNVLLNLKPEQPALIDGNATIVGVAAQVAQIPLPFTNGQGNLNFQKTQVFFNGVAANYGKIPLVAKGSIDSETGFNLAAVVPQVSVANAQKTLNVKLPITATGELEADLVLSGENEKPILSGLVSTIKSARIDQVDFQSVQSRFDFDADAAVINFKDIQGKVKVGGQVTGSGKILLSKVPQINFNLAAANVPGDAIAKIYNVNTFPIGLVSATTNLSGSGNNVQTVVQFQAPQATYPATGEVVVGANNAVTFRNVALKVAGGTVLAGGNANNGRFSVLAQAKGVQLEPFVDPKQLENISLKGAQFNGSLNIIGSSAPFKIDRIDTRNGGVQIGGGNVAISNLRLQDQNFSAQLVASGVRLSNILKQSPPVLQSPLAGTFQIAGNTDNFSLKTLNGTGNASLAAGGGTINVRDIQLKNGAYNAQLLVNNANIQQIATVPQQVQGRFTGDFNVAGTVDSFELPAIQATGKGSLATGNGIITASSIQLNKGLYNAQIQTNNLQLQRLVQIPRQFYGRLTGQFNVAGNVKSFDPNKIQATGQGLLAVASGGRVTASNIQLANGRYEADVNPVGLRLNQFSPELEGTLSGRLKVDGTVESFNLANIRANGQVRLSQGIAGFSKPITGLVAWNGERLNIERATSADLNANGYVTVATKGEPEITGLDLNVQAQNYNLQTLKNIPDVFALTGKADFGGRVTGIPDSPNLEGQIRVRDLLVNNLAFEPVLTGNILSLSKKSLNLNVAGNQDRITLNLDGNNRPQSFLVKWRQAIASGQSLGGDNLAVKVDNFPLQAFNLTPPTNPLLGSGRIGGLLTGNLQVNQKTFAASGDIAIANPEVGRIRGDRAAAKFSYADNTATLITSEFIKGSSRYAFTGTVNPTGLIPQIKGQISTNQAQVQDILTALQLYEIQDFQRGTGTPSYGNAANLNTTGVNASNQPVLTQLQRYFEIQALLDKQQQQRRDSSMLPSLADLKGTFSGTVDVDTSTGLAAKFNFRGQNFVWGRTDEPDRLYRAEQIIAEGSFEDGVLRLLPLRVESNNRLIAFTGNIGGKEQSGQLRINNFPARIVNNYIKLPGSITGNINATANLAGSIDNPQALGSIELIDGTLNQKGIQTASATFNYINGRLNFGSNVIVSGPQPVNINGSIPYKLPFASVAPDSNNISLDVNVKNEGLALLNLFTDQVAFESGEGTIDLSVRGTRQQPLVNGIATLNNATFSAQALPGRLTNISGKAQFDFDRILVESLQGDFSRGKVEAAGEIPIFNNEQNITNPLTVSLDQLVLNLKGLYQGAASGKLQVTGAALSPVIGGKVTLNDGRVLLSESTVGSSDADTPIRANKQDSPTETSNSSTRFNNLELELGRNLRITRPPLLDFVASGILNVNGSLSALQPTGVIRLNRGGVNLFTTQFNLVRNYEHTAIFDGGLDPELDIRLSARVLSAIRSIDLTPRRGGEPESLQGLAALETVRVEAAIQGPASKLNENLVLTSSPARSQPEIVALLGGGFVDTQGRGDSTLGLINIAGSAVLSNFQSTFNQVATTFGLSDFRIFPTIISEDPEAGRGSSSLELAAEAGVDISPRFSVSAIKILTANDPFQLGINYRINEEFRLRGSSNFSNDSRTVIEYERRF
jgi:translocation and assembly module TamB